MWLQYNTDKYNAFLASTVNLNTIVLYLFSPTIMGIVIRVKIDLHIWSRGFQQCSSKFQSFSIKLTGSQVHSLVVAWNNEKEVPRLDLTSSTTPGQQIRVIGCHVAVPCSHFLTVPTHSLVVCEADLEILMLCVRQSVRQFVVMLKQMTR